MTAQPGPPGAAKEGLVWGGGLTTDRKGDDRSRVGGLTRARARPMVPVPQHTSSTVLPASSWAQSRMSV